MSCIPCDRWMSFGGFCLLCWTPRKLCWSVRIQVKIVARSSPVQSNVQTVEIWALTLLREAARGASTIYNIHQKKTEREAQGLKGSYRFVLETSSNSQNISDCPPMFMEFSVALPHQKPWQMHGIYITPPIIASTQSVPKQETVTTHVPSQENFTLWTSLPWPTNMQKKPPSRVRNFGPYTSIMDAHYPSEVAR